jgi:uncharacterized membrane protein
MGDFGVNERVAAVVGGYMRLNPLEQTVAYVEVDEVWKRSRQDELTDSRTAEDGGAANAVAG